MRQHLQQPLNNRPCLFHCRRPDCHCQRRQSGDRFLRPQTGCHCPQPRLTYHFLQRRTKCWPRHRRSKYQNILTPADSRYPQACRCPHHHRCPDPLSDQPKQLCPKLRNRPDRCPCRRPTDQNPPRPSACHCRPRHTGCHCPRHPTGCRHPRPRSECLRLHRLSGYRQIPIRSDFRCWQTYRRLHRPRCHCPQPDWPPLRQKPLHNRRCRCRCHRQADLHPCRQSKYRFLSRHKDCRCPHPPTKDHSRQTRLGRWPRRHP